MLLSQAANLYFLVIAVLQSIPLISPLTPVTAIAPLVFVIAVSLLREAVEDSVSAAFHCVLCLTRPSLTPLLLVVMNHSDAAHRTRS